MPPQPFEARSPAVQWHAYSHCTAECTPLEHTRRYTQSQMQKLAHGQCSPASAVGQCVHAEGKHRHLTYIRGLVSAGSSCSHHGPGVRLAVPAGCSSGGGKHSGTAKHGFSDALFFLSAFFTTGFCRGFMVYLYGSRVSNSLQAGHLG